MTQDPHLEPGMLTRPLDVDAKTLARLRALHTQAVLKTVRAHAPVGDVSVGEFEIHWADNTVVHAYETLASFGAMVSVRPGSAHGRATLMLFALAYGEPSVWFVDGDDEARDVTAVWLARPLAREVSSLLTARALASYRWREARKDEVLRGAAPIV